MDKEIKNKIKKYFYLIFSLISPLKLDRISASDNAVFFAVSPS
jgi:hypothetical protein